MPYIKRFPSTPRNRNNRKRNKSDKEKLRVRLYNKKAWKHLREGYLMSHPLCEKCLEDGKVTPATDVHHINSPFDDGLTEEQRLGRLMDINNLMCLCKECHGTIHRNQQKYFDKNEFLVK